MKIVPPTVFRLYTICKYLNRLLRLRSMLRTRFVMLVLSKAQERLNKQRILFIAETLNFWAPLSDQNIRIIRSIYSIKDTMEQLDFIITKITQNSGQQYDCAMNNMQKIPYFLACQKIYRMYINKFKRENTQNGQIIHHQVYCFK